MRLRRDVAVGLGAALVAFGAWVSIHALEDARERSQAFAWTGLSFAIAGFYLATFASYRNLTLGRALCHAGMLWFAGFYTTAFAVALFESKVGWLGLFYFLFVWLTVSMLLRDSSPIRFRWRGGPAFDDPPTPRELRTFRLWPGDAPHARGDGPADVPTLTPFLPPGTGRDRPAVVVCPGGGYAVLADHEGADYARFLNGLGIAAFVLRYRLGSDGYRHPAPLADVRRAVRTVRAQAGEWGVDPGRIGVMGSSAGGHLAACAAVFAAPGDPDAADPVERASSRPDFAILCYAVTTFLEFGHRGSQDQLLGPDADPAAREALSPASHVGPDHPPAFLWHTNGDAGVPPENSEAYARALRAAGVPYELHLYPGDRHGIGLAPDPAGRPHPWTAALAAWLEAQDLLPEPPR